MTPKQIVGNGEIVCISFKTHYILFDVANLRVYKEMIETKSKPLCLLVYDGKYYFIYDKKMIMKIQLLNF